MKRAIAALCVLAFFAGMVSCKKDKNEEIIPSGNENVYENPTYVEGVFNPGRHLVTIVGPGISQQWSWNEGKPKQLTGISDVVNTQSYNFSYKGSGRLATSLYNAEGNNFAYTFEYDEGYLDKMVMRKNGSVWLEGIVSHADGHIGRIDYDELSDDFINSMAMQLLGRDINNVSFGLLEPSFSVVYSWNGKNVMSENYTANVAGSMSLMQLYNLFSDEISDGNLGSYAALLPILIENMGDSSYFYSVDVDATISYTYDTNYNPYLGFWGDGLLLNTKVLSANNITAATLSGTVHFVSTIAIHLPSECPAWIPEQYQAFWFIIQPLLNGLEIPVDETFPLEQSQTFDYKYNATGFPTEYTTEDGKTYTLTYKEK